MYCHRYGIQYACQSQLKIFESTSMATPTVSLGTTITTITIPPLMISGYTIFKLVYIYRHWWFQGTPYLRLYVPRSCSPYEPPILNPPTASRIAMDVIYCTLTYYGDIHPLRSNFHAITKRVTSYILWNDHGLASVITNVAAVHLVYFEVLYCCLLVDVLKCGCGHHQYCPRSGGCYHGRDNYIIGHGGQYLGHGGCRLCNSNINYVEPSQSIYIPYVPALCTCTHDSPTFP